MHDLLLFPGNLQVERDHCLTPVNSSHPDYFQVNKALSELNTEELKARARKNLGINKNISWGDIQGDIENQEDLKQQLQEILNVATDEWIDVLN